MPRAIRETERHRRSRAIQDVMKSATGPQVLEKVAEGETGQVAFGNYAGDIGEIEPPMDYVVAAKCEHDSRAGQWVCMTHKMTFSNQFCKDSHIHEGTHRLGWFCNHCGNVQVP